MSYRPWRDHIQGVVLSDVGAEPQGVRKGYVPCFRLVGRTGLVGQLEATVPTVAVCKIDKFLDAHTLDQHGRSMVRTPKPLQIYNVQIRCPNIITTS